MTAIYKRGVLAVATGGCYALSPDGSALTSERITLLRDPSITYYGQRVRAFAATGYKAAREEILGQLQKEGTLAPIMRAYLAGKTSPRVSAIIVTEFNGFLCWAEDDMFMVKKVVLSDPQSFLVTGRSKDVFKAMLKNTDFYRPVTGFDFLKLPQARSNLNSEAGGTNLFHIDIGSEGSGIEPWSQNSPPYRESLDNLKRIVDLTFPATP